MAWIDTYVYNYSEISVLPNETFQMFVGRCKPALQTLDPDLTDEQAQEYCEDVWNKYIFNNASQLTVTLVKPIDPNSIYNCSWDDWQIAEIHSAVMPGITFNAVEKSRDRGQSGSGDMFRISKSREDEQLVFGWANIAKDANGDYPLDWDGDFADPEDLEKAAYNFVLKYRATGENHEGEVKGQLVESVMLTKEKQEALGIPEGIVPEGWWVGFHIPDEEVFKKIKSGEYQMFSVQGLAQRIPKEDTE